MFTGIVQALGIVLAATDTPAGKRLTVSLAELVDAPISPGDSVCVSGVCLTVVKRANGNLSFDVITETLHKTTLGRKIPQDRVNLELSLQPHSFVGGHFVQGHVDAVATVHALAADPANWRITFRLPPNLAPAIVPKGSVAVDGVSMTIADVSNSPDACLFTLAVIPTTLEKTTLSALAVGDLVNVETDILARSVAHCLSLMAQSGRAPSPPRGPLPVSTAPPDSPAHDEHAHRWLGVT
ncbi:MAG TPA: riboflavin synthase [Phycisphaerae bacterium]|nr:riboflavin synthase [Phycisphaerae bacterium]